jgi:hypothetical protein
LSKAEPTPGADTVPQQQPAETDAYIAELAATLATLARAQQFEALTYLLDLARLEAESLAQRTGAPPSP